MSKSLDDKDVWEVRRMLPIQELKTPEEQNKVLEDALDLIAWGVLGQMVVVVTVFERILFTVNDNGLDQVRVECFPDEVDLELDPGIKTFLTCKADLIRIKEKISKTPDRKRDFSAIVYGQWSSTP